MKELDECKLCPFECKVNRNENHLGRCKAGKNIKIGLYSLHYDEEPCISGKEGSGTVFFSNCNLKCKYCQNRDTWEINAGNQYSAEELLNKILKYKNYFLASGGGVTVSGGEPLLQYKFLIELFTLLKKENIHTAIDTSGNVDLTDDMKKLIDLTDLFLLDIKCINDEICKILTGVSN